LLEKFPALWGVVRQNSQRCAGGKESGPVRTIPDPWTEKKKRVIKPSSKYSPGGFNRNGGGQFVYCEKHQMRVKPGKERLRKILKILRERKTKTLGGSGLTGELDERRRKNSPVRSLGDRGENRSILKTTKKKKWGVSEVEKGTSGCIGLALPWV